MDSPGHSGGPHARDPAPEAASGGSGAGHAARPTPPSVLSAWWVTALVLVAAVVLRLAVVAADAPDYPRYGAAWGDEGPWAWPAAYRSVTGEWPAAAETVVRGAPAYEWTLAWFLQGIGPGLVQARLLSLLAGVGTVLLLIQMGRAHISSRAGFLAACLYVPSFWPILYERHAAPESLAVFLATASAALALSPRPLLRQAVAPATAVLAFAAKATLVFLPVLILWAPRWTRRRDPPAPRPTRRHRILALLVVGAAALVFLLQLVSTASFVSTASPSVSSPWPWLTSLAWRVLTAPLHADFFLSMPVVLVGLILLAVRGAPESPGARACAVLFTGWVAAWWAIIPLYDLKGSRYYLLTVPLVMLATLGWSGGARRPRPSTHPSGGSRVRWPGWAVAGALSLWVALLLAIEGSIVAGVRARGSLPVLAPVALAVAALFLTRPTLRDRVTSLLGTGRVVSWVAVGVLATHVPWWWHWRSHATTEALGAVRTVAEAPTLEGGLCGGEAPLLLLGQPGRGQALYPVYQPDCVLEGRRADLVVVAVTPECVPFEGAWIRDRRPRLLAQEPLLAVTLPAAASQRQPCEFRVVATP